MTDTTPEQAAPTDQDPPPPAPARPAAPAMDPAAVAVAHRQGATLTVMCDSTCGRLVGLYAGTALPPELDGHDDPAEAIRVAAGCRDTPLACSGTQPAPTPGAPDSSGGGGAEGLNVAASVLAARADITPTVMHITTLMTAAADTPPTPGVLTPQTLATTPVMPPHIAETGPRDEPVLPAQTVTVEQVAEHLGVDPALVGLAVTDDTGPAVPERPADAPANPPEDPPAN